MWGLVIGVESEALGAGGGVIPRLLGRPLAETESLGILGRLAKANSYSLLSQRAKGEVGRRREVSAVILVAGVNNSKNFDHILFQDLLFKTEGIS